MFNNYLMSYLSIENLTLIHSSLECLVALCGWELSIFLTNWHIQGFVASEGVDGGGVCHVVPLLSSVLGESTAQIAGLAFLEIGDVDFHVLYHKVFTLVFQTCVCCTIFFIKS